MKEVKKKQKTAPKEPKETQGHRKMLQRVEDLRRNKNFLKYLKKYEKNSKANDEIIGNGWGKLLNEYLALNDKAERFLKKYHGKFYKSMEGMAEGYGLDDALVGYIRALEKQSGYANEDVVDMCRWDDSYDKNNSDPFEPNNLPLLMRPRDKIHSIAYPVSIEIHRFAAKNDVLDFIEKNWERIYVNSLGIHTDYKPVRFRKRKLSREIVDFIWDNKSKKGKEVKKLLDEKYPHNGIVYYEIPKIISIERERRLG
jgi:hypothetical protein